MPSCKDNRLPHKYSVNDFLQGLMNMSHMVEKCAIEQYMVRWGEAEVNGKEFEGFLVFLRRFTFIYFNLIFYV